MSSEVVRELFRNLEHTLHDRLKVIEDILSTTKQSVSTTAPEGKAFDPSPILERLTDLEGHFRSLDEYTMGQIRTLAFNHDQLELRVEAMERLMKSAVESFRTINDTIGMLQKRVDDIPVEVAEVEAEIEEAQEAALNADEESVVIEEATKEVLAKAVDALDEEEEVDEDEDEDDADDEPDLEVFTYKKKDYCRDQDNNVYAINDEGEADLSEVIGIWNPTTKKIDAPPEKEEEPELEAFEYKKKTYCRDQKNNVYPVDDDGCADVSEIVGIWNPKTNKIDPVPSA
jgi:hypothetical protein